MKSIAGPPSLSILVLDKSTVQSVIVYGEVCFSGMSDSHMRKLERIQWRVGRICFGLMGSTDVLSVKVLAGIPSIRQRLSLLSERFLVSALVTPKD
jgi:hypothetical protein